MPPDSEFVAGNPEDLARFARTLAADLGPGSVLALTGDLGAGKTHLCQALASALGVTVPVTSPTFTLVHEYPSARLPVFHFDFYRAEAAAEILALGWDDYLDREGVVVAEWADKFPGLFPADTLWIHLEILGPTRRALRITSLRP
jgi:tRNA threonylcarbamoyladenosine biosynthesis protein TsaE